MLAIPLLVLLLLHLLNLLALARRVGAGAAPASAALALLWGGLTLLGLLVALRACWDPPGSDPTPWLGLNLPAQLQLQGAGGVERTLAVELSALSENGAALRLPLALPAGWRPRTLQLSPEACGAVLPPLPLRGTLPRGQRLTWGPDAAGGEREALQRWLYGRPGAWPQRHAPPEWRALAALLLALLRPGRALNPRRLSLVPQQLGPAPDRSGG